ncbi:CLUMA_CG017220, isoform A [Clunio marinus]|uniref:CLUMA_CG017220, isoform A n=1 Tax=Clunio marinus TaxID=568069 RepID=A0A1J1IV26_9DIPT|nr:CLUMA_CG017220, isoform A [Clunio marinus]
MYFEVESLRPFDMVRKAGKIYCHQILDNENSVCRLKALAIIINAKNFHPSSKVKTANYEQCFYGNSCSTNCYKRWVL